MSYDDSESYNSTKSLTAMFKVACATKGVGQATGLLRMGVPSFYRWLADKYSKVVVDCLEVENQDPSEIDTSLPNPNGIEVCA